VPDSDPSDATGVDAPPPNALDRLRNDRVVRGVMAIVGIVAIVLAIRTIASRWNDAAELDLDLRPGPVAVAAACVVVANTILAGSWAWLLARLGNALAPTRALQIWWTGQLGTYLPTGLGSVPARVLLAVRAGVARSVAVATSALEPLVIVLVCGVDAALLLDGWYGGVLLAIGLAAAAAIVTFALRITSTRSGDVVASPVATGVVYVLLQQAQVLVRAAGLWAAMTVVDPVARPSLVHVVGVVGASYLVGFLVLFAPGGLGAREATMTALLSGTTGTTAAIASAVAWRLLEILVVLPSVAIANLTVRMNRQ
jgi:uncharacterized membrane protein YbhN (UPF0104 family)